MTKKCVMSPAERDLSFTTKMLNPIKSRVMLILKNGQTLSPSCSNAVKVYFNIVSIVVLCVVNSHLKIGLTQSINLAKLYL